MIIKFRNVWVLEFTLGTIWFHSVYLIQVFFSSYVILTAPWYISTSLSPKYGICLKGLTDMSTGPMYVCV